MPWREAAVLVQVVVLPQNPPVRRQRRTLPPVVVV